MIAYNSREPQFTKLFNSVIGIQFLGTPHRGSANAPWLKIVATSLRTLRGCDIDENIIAVLERDSEVLARIQNCFQEMIKGHNAISICFSYEELPLGGFKMVRIPLNSSEQF